MQYCRSLIIISCCLLFSVKGFSQSSPEGVDMTGLWTGLMYNDTTELSYRYEIAISEKNGNLIGYSHTYFILDNKEYYGVKKLKITVDGNKIITQDLKLIDNNYPIKPPKGVYVVNVLNFEKKDAVMILSGHFETNRTKQYAPATGYIHVERKTNLEKSSLVTQLERLGLVNELSFIEPEKPVEPTVVAKVEREKEQPIAKVKPIEKEKKVKVAKEKPIKETEQPVVKTEAPKTITVKQTQAAGNIRDRIIETIQSVDYKSDSLVLSLYDNGEVDGDTVSVLMNGDVIMPMVGLSTNAVRKTIYTKDMPDTIQLVMYAETLGSLPPNTGLLIVYDGADRYEIRFSGDLKKNAAIVFRRRKN